MKYWQITSVGFALAHKFWPLRMQLRCGRELTLWPGAHPPISKPSETNQSLTDLAALQSCSASLKMLGADRVESQKALQLQHSSGGVHICSEGRTK